MKQEYIVKTPHTMSHSHFHEYIEDFPQLHDHHHDHHENELPQKQQTLDVLRLELKNYALNPRHFESVACYKNCFTMLDKEYVDYCLQKKCDSNIRSAADYLGWSK